MIDREDQREMDWEWALYGTRWNLQARHRDIPYRFYAVPRALMGMWMPIGDLR